MEQTWREFERRVEAACSKLNDELVRVAAQKPAVHCGLNKRYDIHIAERRQGGKSVVLDAKHFTTPLPKHEINTTLKYKTDGRASGVAVIVSATTTVLPAVHEHAAASKVAIITDNRNLASNIKKFVSQFMDC
eukprot:m.10942 g.10942  ORF g.10942 m.10942 type:complete len:133 (+) comp9719_c0_seq1:65-463(+)